VVVLIRRRRKTFIFCQPVVRSLLKKRILVQNRGGREV
jgi:hypothetical protein